MSQVAKTSTVDEELASMIQKSTIKTANFRPQGNFGRFFSFFFWKFRSFFGLIMYQK
jgi:hypothetical protein